MQTATASLSLVSSVAVHSEPVVRRTAIFSGLLKLFVITVLLCDLCHAQDIAGDWQGALKPSTQELRAIVQITRARDFMEHSQSVIFLSFEGTVATGFTQLYPSLSSGAMGRIFILKISSWLRKHWDAEQDPRCSARSPNMHRASERCGLCFRLR
jgi:hypothetical protein